MANVRILPRFGRSFLIRMRMFGIASMSLLAARLSARYRDPKLAHPGQDRSPPQSDTDPCAGGSRS
jgi:hypothetical protein